MTFFFPLNIYDSWSVESMDAVLPVCAKSLQTCLTLCDLMNRSPPGSSVHRILQVRTLEWVAMPLSRGSSQLGIKPTSSLKSACSGKRVLYHQSHQGSSCLLHVCVNIYTHIYIHIHTCTYIHICTYMHTDICVYVCVCIYTYIHTVKKTANT